jgi:AraC-like DNA-binding protein
LGNLFIVPILRGNASKAPIQFFKWSAWGVLGISLTFSILSWAGVSLAVLKMVGYFLIFCTHSGMVFYMVVYRKIVREAMLIINNLSFMLVLMADFISYILLSMAFMANSGWFASIFVSLLSILVLALQYLWFFKWESRVSAPEVKSFSIVESRPADILSERELEYGGYGIKARLYQLFDEEKPYLNPDLTIGEVSDMLYVNKSYLSKTLNNNLNVNFNEFVNNYRVNEARRIFMEDHNITLEEMRVKSGFRHASSFNNAFKICTGHTPGEWCRSIKREDVCNGSVEENF